MKKVLPIIIFVLIAAGAAYFLVFAGNSNNPTTSTNQTPEVAQSDDSTQTDASLDTSTKYTAAQVAERNTAQECWTIINDKVYNLSSYIPRHPGGDEILLACGNDGTSLFEQRTTADGQVVGGGGSHSSSAEASLKELQIGTLDN